MIMGLSHIALTCKDIKAAAAQLHRLGYTTTWTHKGLENHILKEKFVDQHHPTHDIERLEVPGGMSIELLDHHSTHPLPQTGILFPVFRTQAPLPDWQPRDLAILPFEYTALPPVLDSSKAFYDPILDITLLWTPAYNGDHVGLNTVIWPTEDLNHTASVLTRLRFRQDPKLEMWQLLTPLPKLQARVLPLPRRTDMPDMWSFNPLLDAAGCACMAFMVRPHANPILSNDTLDEKVDFPLTVHGTKTHITLAQLTNGPVIELVEAPT